MAKNIRLEDIIFWLLIIGIIAVALWLLHGSPPETNALITIAIFVATSELLLWKALFSIDKKTAIGFEKMKNDLKNFRSDIGNKLSNINNNLNEIKISIKK